jgi:hypothetical protein
MMIIGLPKLQTLWGYFTFHRPTGPKNQDLPRKSGQGDITNTGYSR